MKKIHLGLVLWLVLDFGVYFVYRTLSPRSTEESSPALTLMVDGNHLYHQLEQRDASGTLHAQRQIQAENASGWPRLRHHNVAKRPFQVVSHSTLNGSLHGNPSAGAEQGQTLILIDDWNKARNMHCPVFPWPQESIEELVIFIDRSGTMKQSQKGQANALAQSYTFLSRQRQLEITPWRILSFSDDTLDHGLWTLNGPIPMAAFSSSHGHTRLLENLETFFLRQTKPCTVVVLSDGKIDTRHGESLERSFAKWKGAGHRIHLLSPSGQPLMEWQESYDKKWLSYTWPQEHIKPPLGRDSTDLTWGLTWSNVIPTICTPALLPMLVDEQGWPILYMISRDSELYLYATGIPLQREHLLTKLETLFQHRPVVRLSENTAEIDVGRASLKALKYFGADSESILPTQAGIYKVNLAQHEAMEFFHPDTGLFSLENLSSWRQSLPQDGQAPKTNIKPKDIWLFLVVVQLIWLLVCLFPKAYKLIKLKIIQVIHVPHRSK